MYALSPKLVKQLKLNDKMEQKLKEEEDDKVSTAGMNLAEIHEYRRKKEQEMVKN